MKRLMLPLLLVAMSFLVLESCSRFETGVKWADWLIMREADSYFDLTDIQDKKYRAEIQKDIEKVRRESFPEIASFFRKVTGKVERNDINREEINSLHSEGMSVFTGAMNQFKDTAINFTFEATPGQMERFKEKFNEKTEEMKEKVETDKKKYKQEVKRFERWLEEWVDDLSDEQEEAMEAHIKAHPFPWDLQIQSREKSFGKFLEARKDRGALTAYFNDMIGQRDPAYKTALAEYHQHLRDYIFGLYKSLSPDQKKHLLKRLEKWASELETLSKKK